MRARLPRAVVAVALVGMIGLTLVGTSALAQTADPVVTLDRTGTAAGETMLVRGERWPDGATLIAELCGHGGLRGSVDCDVGHQATAGVGPSGQFAVEISVGLPPAPCPCIVKVTDQSTQISASAPIAVAGLPTVAITADDAPATRSLEISGARITGGQRIAELFGFAGRRVLAFTLVNSGAVAVDSPRVTIAWGRGENPDGFVKPPPTSRLEPGQTQTFTVALDRPAMTLGSQTALIEIDGLGVPVTARAKATGYPWGLLAIALLILQLVLLRIRNRVRRRIAPAEQTPPVALAGAVLELPVPTPALTPAVVDAAAAPAEPPVIDLVAVEADRGASPDYLLDAESHTAMNGASGGQVELRRFGTGADAPPVGSTLSTDLAVMRTELAEMRQRAEAALGSARELAEGVTRSTEARLHDIEEQARQITGAAEASLAASLDALTAARAQVDSLLADAASAADDLRRAAAAERDAAAAELDAMRRDREQLLDAGIEAIEEVLREVDDRAQRLAGLIEWPDDGSPATEDPSGAFRAPRIGDLDGRLSEAISRAFASVRGDEPDAD